MTHDRLRLGRAGEDAACAFLRSRGYRVLDRNARASGVELDVVAERRDVVAFVEVKTRRSSRFGSAAEAVDARKRARLARGAAAWLQEHPARGRRARFDVVTCMPAAGGGFRVEHWEGAFESGE